MNIERKLMPLSWRKSKICDICNSTKSVKYEVTVRDEPNHAYVFVCCNKCAYTTDFENHVSKKLS